MYLLAAARIVPPYLLAYTSTKSRLTLSPLPLSLIHILYGRMIEIYLVTSIAPIPVATMVNREWGGMGQNYLKSLLALGLSLIHI